MDGGGGGACFILAAAANIFWMVSCYDTVLSRSTASAIHWISFSDANSNVRVKVQPAHESRAARKGFLCRLHLAAACELRNRMERLRIDALGFIGSL